MTGGVFLFVKDTNYSIEYCQQRLVMLLFTMPIRWTIPELLEKKGWTAYRLAQETGLTVQAAYRLAKGEPVQRIDADTLERLCRVFEVQIGDILELEPPIQKTRR
jgi:DNA-binding Xre family transcriptional regulator